MILEKYIKNSSVFFLYKLLNFIKPQIKIKLLIALFLMGLSSLSEVISISSAIPLLSTISSPDFQIRNRIVLQFINILNLSSKEEILILLVLIFSSAAIFSSFFRLLSLNYSYLLSADLGTELSVNVFSEFICKPYQFHLNKNSSEIITNNSVLLNLVVASYNQALQFVQALIISFGIISLLLFINATAIIILFFLLAFSYFLAAKIFRKRLYKQGKKVGVLAESQIKFTQESIKSIRDIILDSQQHLFVKKFNFIDKPMRIYQAKSQFLSIVPRYLIESLSLIFIALISLFFINQPNGQVILISSLGAIVLGLQKLLPSMQQIYGAWAMIKSYKHALEKIYNALSSKKENIAGNFDLEEFNENVNYVENIFVNSINLDKVTFEYEDGKKAIEEFSLEINKSEIIGLRGPSGAGKSTICDILMTLIIPKSGKLLIDNKDLYAETSRTYLYEWRRKIAHVPQEIFLLDTTIKENIIFPMQISDCSESKLSKALEISELIDFINDLPKGVDTLVGEGGCLLSGGQKQRIGLARAIYRDLPLLVLDEATSALDKDTEQKVLQNIKNYCKEKTIIIVSHSQAAFGICDRIIDISYLSDL